MGPYFRVLNLAKRPKDFNWSVKGVISPKKRVLKRTPNRYIHQNPILVSNCDVHIRWQITSFELRCEVLVPVWWDELGLRSNMKKKIQTCRECLHIRTIHDCLDLISNVLFNSYLCNILADCKNVVRQLLKELVRLKWIEPYVIQTPVHTRTLWASTPPGGNPSDSPVPTEGKRKLCISTTHSIITYRHEDHQSQPIRDRHLVPGLHVSFGKRLDSNVLTLATFFMRETKDAKSPKVPLNNRRP